MQLVFSRVFFIREVLPARKTAGKKRKCHVCFVLGIDEEGWIERVVESLLMGFDGRVGLQGYNVRDGRKVAGSRN